MHYDCLPPAWYLPFTLNYNVAYHTAVLHFYLLLLIVSLKASGSYEIFI